MSANYPDREQALTIWRAGVAAVQPKQCLEPNWRELELDRPDWLPWSQYARIVVVGGGKAGAAMAEALEACLAVRKFDLSRLAGLVNVPAETGKPLAAIRLHAARPGGMNQPTEQAMAGALEMLRMVDAASPRDLVICLLSGGGSALLPAPVPGVSLADKQTVTLLLHRSGASIHEMNAVRKHLSLIKGGGLLRRLGNKRVVSLIVSDVVGDPLDVIASGPTCEDPTTFADALAVLEKYQLTSQVPDSVRDYLTGGGAGQAPETLKSLPISVDGRPTVENRIIASSRHALAAAERKAVELGYQVLNLGDSIEGDTQAVASVLADIARGLGRGGGPRAIACLSGGETIVRLPPDHGLGGRNQELVLAMLHRLGSRGLRGITILSGGTDGEDGPTDAAGAWGDQFLLARAAQMRLSPADYLNRHDAYHFFEAVGGLVKTGHTETNVMDLRVILINP